jgi:hypothetical protein
VGAYVAAFSADFWEKFWLILVDKAALGLGFAIMGYLLQRQLEVFKRNQAFASEVAKLRIGAYYRVLAATSAANAAAQLLASCILVPGLPSKTRSEAEEGYKKARDALSAAWHLESHLVNPSFGGGVLLWAERLHEYVEKNRNGGFVDDAARIRDFKEVVVLREALMGYLPKFARVPGDEHFSAPSPDAALTAFFAKATLTKEPKKGEAA